MIPHKCPCCDGTGQVSRPPWIAGDVVQWISTSTAPYPCKACTGSGIVWEIEQILTNETVKIEND